MEKRGLGKGLGALISSTMADDDAASVRQVRVDRVRPNPYQPRQTFDAEKLQELVESVREHGILQPVLVRRTGADAYELIAGERRLRAAQEAGLKAVPAIVRDYDDRQMLEVAIIENVQREDINAVDAAEAYRRLSQEFGLTQEQIAQRVGKARPTVANTLRLLTLPELVLGSLRRGEIAEAHARAILQVSAPQQVAAWQTIRKRHMSVREAERLAQRLQEGAAQARRRRTTDPNLAAVEQELQEALGTRVTIRRSGTSGRIEIEFYSDDELDGLVERIIGGALSP